VIIIISIIFHPIRTKITRDTNETVFLQFTSATFISCEFDWFTGCSVYFVISQSDYFHLFWFFYDPQLEAALFDEWRYNSSLANDTNIMFPIDEDQISVTRIQTGLGDS